MANWKKIGKWTLGVIVVAGLGYGGYRAYGYFKEQDKDMKDVKNKVENHERRLTTVENQIDTLAAWDAYFEYTLDSLGNVVDSAIIEAHHADSVAHAADKRSRKAQKTADSALVRANRALDCCNGSNNAGDTAVAVKPVNPGNSNSGNIGRKPGTSTRNNNSNNNNNNNNSGNNRSNNKPGNSVNKKPSSRPGNPSRVSGNPSQQVIVYVNGCCPDANPVTTTPVSKQRTSVVINGVTYSDVTEVSRELNADVQIVYDTIRQRVH